MKKKTEPKKPWDITQSQVESITHKEFIYGTTRLLPPEDEIPKEFWTSNIYTRVVEAMYVGEKPEHAQVDFLPGFINDGISLARVTMAHIRSVEPSYEHKIAGVAYLISKVVHITAILNK